ncbi:hypothetical protein [Bacillus sp. 03113]|uniref:hypothetical protein n=1 Tax=Bacillus sp. 03113 TaxID=2578211 RepID=UPI0011438A75|nr:hypothetical protein [Bacillus sp. 03113]
MKLEEEFVGRSLHFAELLKKVAKQVESENILIRGKKIALPNEDMEFKISHKSDYGANKLTILIEWLEKE